MDEAIRALGLQLDDFASHYHRLDVADEDGSGAGVPIEMQVGAIDADGWVEWRVLPSKLSRQEVEQLETEFGARFPGQLRAYLLARFHLFDQVRSQRYQEQLMMTPLPSREPLRPLRRLLQAWGPLVKAKYLPFAEWGDGWGPLCFDLAAADANTEDAPLVWFDHEVLASLGQSAWANRSVMSPVAQPLYSGFRELFVDVFGSRS